MLQNAKRVYAFASFSIKCQNARWYYRKTDSNEDWKGSYGSEISVVLMIARDLNKEVRKRDAVHRLPE